MLKREELITYAGDGLDIEVDPQRGQLRVRDQMTGATRLDVPLGAEVDTITEADAVGQLNVESVTADDTALSVTFRQTSSLWHGLWIRLHVQGRHVSYRVEVEGVRRDVTDVRLLRDANGGGRTEADSVYVPRFDWLRAQVTVPTDANESLAAQQWLSPPPLVYVFGTGDAGFWAALAPEPGSFNLQSFDYLGASGLSFRLTLEGHTRVDGRVELPELIFGFGDGDGNIAVEGAVAHLRTIGRLPVPHERAIPEWWHEPIFCGWGQMRFDYRRDHAGHENGTFTNVTSYCTELRYRNYLGALDRVGIDPGTVVIDMGWARDAALGEPDPDRWSDMRTFIDEQHARGRRVLLWYAPVLYQGLPTEACMTLDGDPVAADPTSARYREILAAQLERMLSPDGGLDADGLKIDFTQCVPSESGRFVSRLPHFGGLINEADPTLLYPRLGAGRTETISTEEPIWGIEMVRRHLELIHTGAHRIKADAMIIAHAANPYFADVIDVLRLNDLDGDCEDVLGVMRNRAALAEISGPYWLIDTDDDLMIDRDRWMAYAELQPRLGIPDTYYATGIANSQERFSDADYRRLREIWADYRAHRSNGSATRAATT